MPRIVNGTEKLPLGWYSSHISQYGRFSFTSFREILEAALAASTIRRAREPVFRDSMGASILDDG